MIKCQKQYKMKKRAIPKLKTQTLKANSKIHIMKNLNQLIKRKIPKEKFRQETH